MWLVIVTKVSSEEKRPRRRIGHWKKHEGKQGLGSVTRPKDAEWIKVSSTRGASASTSTWRLSLVMPNDSSSVWLTDCPCPLHCTLTFSLFLPFCRSLSILADIERGPDSGQTSPRSSYFPFYSYWSRPFESTFERSPLREFLRGLTSVCCRSLNLQILFFLCIADASVLYVLVSVKRFRWFRVFIACGRK